MRWFLIFFLLLLSGCKTREVFIEKNSEALSQAVYAADDSVKAGRFDLTGKYTGEATRIVPPPQTRIPIKPLQQKIENVVVNKETGEEEIIVEWRNYALIPEELRNTRVVIVGSAEWEELAKTEHIAKQLQADLDYYQAHASVVDKQLQVNEGNMKKLIDLNNALQLEKERLGKIIAQRNLTIFTLSGFIVSCGLIFVALLYFRVLRFGL